MAHHNRRRCSTPWWLCGVWGCDLVAQLGDRLNIYPVKGYSITVHLQDEGKPARSIWVSLFRRRDQTVTSRLGADRPCSGYRWNSMA